ncbi:MAG: hypothetical protein M1269_02955 [Chloroflexi bacterium]|nr:hypothetical protein [Chloroflexota bacterium]
MWKKPGNESKFQKYLNYRKELNEKAFMKKVSKEYLNISNKEYPRYYYLAGKMDMDWEELSKACDENYFNLKVLFNKMITGGLPRVVAYTLFSMDTLNFLPRALFVDLGSLAELRSFRLFNAIEGYRNKYGKNPGSLSDLIPGFIDKIPIDPFSGKPLKYIVTSKGPAVYSTGPDKEDNKAEKDLNLHDREHYLTKGLDIIFYQDSNKYK